MFHVERKPAGTETAKSQTIRLLDVFVLGPFMIYVGHKAKGLSKLERGAMYALGAATIYYNGANYVGTKRALEAGTGTSPVAAAPSP